MKTAKGLCLLSPQSSITMPIMLIAKTFSTLNIFCGVGRGSLSNSRIPPPFHFQQLISILLLPKQPLKTGSLLQRIIKVATGSSPAVFNNPSADTYKGSDLMLSVVLLTSAIVLFSVIENKLFFI